VIRYITCLLSLLFAGGFYFFLELFDSYLGIDDEWHDSFSLDTLLLVTYFALTVAAGAGVIVGLFRRQKASIVACRALLVVCAGFSFWFRVELNSFSDQFFFSLNEPSFNSKIQAAGGKSASLILHGRSSYNFYRMFGYSGLRSLPNGRLSLDEIDSFGGDLDELRKCRVYATSLRDNCYILSIYCG
jgi:hypothetical protein